MTKEAILLGRQISLKQQTVNPAPNTPTLVARADATRVAVTIATLGATFAGTSQGYELGYSVGGTFFPVLGLTVSITHAHATIATHGQFVQGELWVRNTSGQVTPLISVIEYTLEQGAGL